MNIAQPIHFISSNGELYVNQDGTISDKSDLSDWLLDIAKVDIAEWFTWTAKHNIESDCGDVLELAYWDKSGNYIQADLDFRNDMVANKLHKPLSYEIEMSATTHRTFTVTANNVEEAEELAFHALDNDQEISGTWKDEARIVSRTVLTTNQS
jgi:hypothetical protein